MPDEVKKKEDTVSFEDFLSTKSLTEIERKFYAKKNHDKVEKTTKEWETALAKIVKQEQDNLIIS